MRDRRRVVDRDAEHRARHVELFRRQLTGGAVRRTLDEVVVDGQRHELGEVHGRAPDREDRPAVLEELLQLRARLGGRIRPLLALILGRDIQRPGSTAASAATATAAAASAASTGSRRTHAGREDDDVEAAGEVAAVERLGKHDFERKLELLQQPARPARGHRAAVLIGEGNAQLAQLDGVARGPRRHAVEVEAEVGGELAHGRGRRRLGGDEECPGLRAR